MANKPDIRVGVELYNVGIQLLSRRIVTVFIMQGLYHAGGIAHIGACCTVAHLVPRPLPLLGAATAEKEVIVDFIVGGSTIAIKNSG
jgi:hypothetical protein